MTRDRYELIKKVYTMDPVPDRDDTEDPNAPLIPVDPPNEEITS